MNALDQAFIKAFAKDRSAPQPLTRSTATSMAAGTPKAMVQPADAGVESMELVLHDIYQQGQRWRVDRLISPAGARPAPHMPLPAVQNVDTYDVETIVDGPASHVVIEDRLPSYEEPVPETMSQDEPSAEANVATHRDVMVDRDVPALAADSVLAGDDAAVDAHGALGIALIAEAGVTADIGAEASDDEVHRDGQSSPEDSEEDEEPGDEPFVLWAVPAMPVPDGNMEMDSCVSSGPAAPGDATRTVAVECGTLAIDPAILHGPFEQVDGDETARDIVPTDSPPQLAPDQPAAPSDEPLDGDTVDDRQLDNLSLWTAPPAGPAPDDRWDAISAEPGPAEESGDDDATAADFNPAWEVDAFRWPDLCESLDGASGGKLRQSGDELHVATQDGLKVLAVTSSGRHEGRTTLALSLARSAAAAGSRVALVDADGANPELARRLGLEAPCDWREACRASQPLSEAAVASVVDKITLFPLTIPTDGSDEALQDAVLHGALEQLKGAFDLIVVDLPPVPTGPFPGASAETNCQVDMVVIVRNVQSTSQEQTLDSVARLRSLGVRAVGIVENFAPAA